MKLNQALLLFSCLFLLNAACPEKPCIDESKIDENAVCSEDYEPVCGCDNQTYSNACNAEAYGVRKWSLGECPENKSCIDKSKINPDAPCTKEYKPVCGCDSKTYSNECLAENAGVSDWIDGKCEERP